jgi:hypothetical protein
MKQEDKDLLLLDLCSRLPYGVKVESVFINLDTKEHKSCGIEVFDATSILMIRDGLGEFKPYLFPLSSMTKEQKREYHQSTSKDIDMLQDVILERINGKDNTNKHAIAYNGIDWLNAHHFDYRGLIEKGLAIDATGLNIY